jgi:hypothetical protein
MLPIPITLSPVRMNIVPMAWFMAFARTPCDRKVGASRRRIRSLPLVRVRESNILHPDMVAMIASVVDEDGEVRASCSTTTLVLCHGSLLTFLIDD